MLDWLETSHQRMVALLDRVAAGEDVTDAEAVEMLLDNLQMFYDVHPELDTDRVKALADRIVAGEQVGDAEVEATLIDPLTNMGITAS